MLHCENIREVPGLQEKVEKKWNHKNADIKIPTNCNTDKMKIKEAEQKDFCYIYFPSIRSLFSIYTSL